MSSAAAGDLRQAEGRDHPNVEGLREVAEHGDGGRGGAGGSGANGNHLDHFLDQALVVKHRDRSST